jgi:hypothetical protein
MEEVQRIVTLFNFIRGLIKAERESVCKLRKELHEQHDLWQ